MAMLVEKTWVVMDSQALSLCTKTCLVKQILKNVPFLNNGLKSNCPKYKKRKKTKKKLYCRGRNEWVYCFAMSSSTALSPAPRNLPLRLFQVALFAGFAVNMIFIYRAFFNPQAILTPLALPPDAANIWLRNTANLMLTINIFYLPVIVNPTRYPAYSWWAALMRFTGVIFWWVAMQDNPHFLSYLYADLTLG